MVNFVVNQEKGIEVSAADLIAFLAKSSDFTLTDLGSISVLAELFSASVDSLPPTQATIIKAAFEKS